MVVEDVPPKQVGEESPCSPQTPPVDVVSTSKRSGREEEQGGIIGFGTFGPALVAVLPVSDGAKRMIRLRRSKVLVLAAQNNASDECVECFLSGTG